MRIKIYLLNEKSKQRLKSYVSTGNYPRAGNGLGEIYESNGRKLSRQKTDFKPVEF